MGSHIYSEKTAMPKPENIEPHKFKKGQTGNPNGRPRKLPELDKLLADVLGEEKDGVTAGEAILKAIRARAAKGDVRAAELLLDRAYGKPKQSIDNNITTTEPLVIIRTEPSKPAE
jgi:hypothetical protein